MNDFYEQYDKWEFWPPKFQIIFAGCQHHTTKSNISVSQYSEQKFLPYKEFRNHEDFSCPPLPYFVVFLFNSTIETRKIFGVVSKIFVYYGCFLPFKARQKFLIVDARIFGSYWVIMSFHYPLPPVTFKLNFYWTYPLKKCELKN